jgi:hypothetical protein
MDHPTENGSKVQIWDVLLSLGFTEVQSTSSAVLPTVSFDFGNFILEAWLAHNKWSMPVVTFFGIPKSNRKIWEGHHELDREVQSVE